MLFYQGQKSFEVTRGQRLKSCTRDILHVQVPAHRVPQVLQELKHQTCWIFESIEKRGKLMAKSHPHCMSHSKQGDMQVLQR